MAIPTYSRDGSLELQRVSPGRLGRLGRLGRRLVLVLVACLSGLRLFAQMAHPAPAWYDEAKFGVLIHWGVYSVPAFNYRGPYSAPLTHWSERYQAYGEWYWHSVRRGHEPTASYHRRVYGETTYPELARLFRAELFEPSAWAEVFRRAGARYVVMVAKHHDGYALWPSRYAYNWNSQDVGPHRDLLGELSGAVRGAGLRMGVSYSLDSWYDPLYTEDLPRYVSDKLQPQLRELVERVRPSVLLVGGGYWQPMAGFGSGDFLDWLYAESSVRDSVVTNDRWGRDAGPYTGSYFTTEYSDLDTARAQAGKWEEIRGVGRSFGYSRAESLADYATASDLVATLVKVVCGGGNLLLNVGPRADGTLDPLQVERLLQVGAWLGQNGEAIYGTQPYERSVERLGVPHVTTAGDRLYVHLLDRPAAGEIHLTGPSARTVERARVLSPGLALRVDRSADGVVIHLPAEWGAAPGEWTPRVLELCCEGPGAR